MWADRKGWASRAPLSRLQLLGAAGTAEGGNNGMKASYWLSRWAGEAHLQCLASPGGHCTQHAWEGHASPWGKKHWPSNSLALRGGGQGQEQQRWQQRPEALRNTQDEAS